jgi:hypothetical protein
MWQHSPPICKWRLRKTANKLWVNYNDRLKGWSLNTRVIVGKGKKTRNLKEKSIMCRVWNFSWRSLTFTSLSPHTLQLSTIAVSISQWILFFHRFTKYFCLWYPLRPPSVAAQWNTTIILAIFVPLFLLYASSTESFNILCSAQCRVLLLIHPPQNWT